MAASTSTRAFLCSQDGIYNFPLMSKLTTIGSDNCDILLINACLDSQHAVVEYDEEKNIFSIHDLSSANGTFVNGSRINHENITITENDVIQFGHTGVPFQLCLQKQIITPIPPIGLHRQSYNTIQTRASSIYNHSSGQNGFWLTPSQMPNGSFITINNQPPVSTTISHVKPINSGNNASLRTRPLSSQGLCRKEVPNIKLNTFAKGFTNESRVNSETYRQEETNLHQEYQRSIDDERKLKLQIEKELKSKHNEIRDLKDKIEFYKHKSESNSSQQQEIERLKDEKDISNNIIATIQKELSNKEIIINRLNKKLEGAKDELNNKIKIIISLENERASPINEAERLEKEKELYELRMKCKTADERIEKMTNEIAEIKIIFENSQLKNNEYEHIFTKLKVDLEGARTQFIDMERAERLVRIDNEQLKFNLNKLKCEIIKTLYSDEDSIEPDPSPTNDDLIEKLNDLLKKYLSGKEKVSELNETLENTKQEYSAIIINLNLLSNKLKKQVSIDIRRAKSLEGAINELKDFNELESISTMKNSLVVAYESELIWLQEIENKLSQIGINVDNTESLGSLLQVLAIQINSQIEEKSLMEAKLSSFYDTAGKLDELEITINSLNTTKDQLIIKHTKTIEQLKEAHESKVLDIKSVHETKITSMNQEVKELNLTIEIQKKEAAELEEKNKDFIKDLEKIHILTTRVSELEAELSQVEEVFNEKLYKAESSFKNATNSYAIELSIHKEQIKQHSLTIVSFEKSIVQYKQQELIMLDKISMMEQLSYRKEKQTEEIITSDQAKQAIDSMTKECLKYKHRLAEQDELIKNLRRDLIGASAKLSDTHGEMSEKQKRELEKNKQTVSDQQKELSITRAQLAKLSQIVEKQTVQLDLVQPELCKSNAQMEKYRQASDENNRLAIELKNKLESVESEIKKFDNVKSEEGKITCELTAAGAQCKGERHEQVINRQREALNELRQRLKIQEQSRPVTSNNQQQQQQQIMLLKKQLAEVRASQALNEDIVKHVNISRGQDENNFIMEEKTAHYETQTALESSEESYLTLLKTISCLIGIQHLDGLRSMINLPCDERMKLNMERSKSIEMICSRIKGLLEKLKSKEDLLKEYEIDLAKLRQTEFLLGKKTEQLDETHLDTQDKEDELVFLKESLKNARTELDRERVINSAYKLKKTINAVPLPINSACRNSNQTPRHLCKPDSSYDQNQIKKQMGEKIKRKDYELKTLKKEIREKSEELSIMNKMELPL